MDLRSLNKFIAVFSSYIFYWKNVLAFFSSIFIFSSLFAQPDYKVTLQGASQTAPNIFQFDVYIRSTGEDFILTSYQCSFTFNKEIKGSGDLIFQLVENTSELKNKPTIAVGIEKSDVPKLRFASGVGDDTITSAAKKIGKFRLTNSVPFINEFPEIEWCFTEPSNTIFTGITFNNITTPENYFDLIYSSPLPVELTSLSGSIESNNKINLIWETNSEINNFGFEVERTGNIDANKWERIGFMQGKGYSQVKAIYKFTDEEPIKNQINHYRLKQINYDNSYTYSKVLSLEMKPEMFELFQNYPNPFNPETIIKYSIPVESNVNIKIYNSLGEIAENLFDGFNPAGNHEITWNAEKFSSGLYIISFIAKSGDGFSEFSNKKKMLLLK